MIKYRIDFPIKKDCNLFCPYCFHRDYHQNKGIYENNMRYELGFTLDQWQIWRDKFLKNSDEILINVHGGETFVDINSKLILELIKTCKDSIQTYEFLTNGISDSENYLMIINDYKQKIRRIGFTYHRQLLENNEILKQRFINNVIMVKNLGISVYTKELLRVKDRENIISNIIWWKENHNIDVKIQDFKGEDKGFSGEEYEKYSEIDHSLISLEYKHFLGKDCSCLDGYKSFGIHGYDQFGGNCIACWMDPVVIGNIPNMWFNNNFRISREDNSSKRKVIGVPKKYLNLDYSGNPIYMNCNN